MCKIPRKRERECVCVCVGAPCRTKDEMDQLPVVVVSLKSQHPSQKLSSSEQAPVQDRYMYLTIPTFFFV